MTNSSGDQHQVPSGKLSKGRLVAGTAVLILGQASTLLIPLISNSELSDTWKKIVSAMLFFGTPQLGLFIAVAIFGKEGYDYIKGIIRRWLKRYGPAEQVSLFRYRIGLVLFTLPLMLAWMQPYCGEMIPGLIGNEKLFAIVGDVMFAASFFVLGGEFWEKIRSLFIHKARAVIPDPKQSD